MARQHSLSYLPRTGQHLDKPTRLLESFEEGPKERSFVHTLRDNELLNVLSNFTQNRKQRKTGQSRAKIACVRKNTPIGVLPYGL